MNSTEVSSVSCENIGGEVIVYGKERICPESETIFGCCSLRILDSGLPPNQGIQGKSGNFIFIQGKSRGKERYFEKSGKIRRVLELQ